MKVYSNTTPFLALSCVSLLDLMPSLFGTVVVAPAVVQECAEGGRIMVPDLTSLPWVSVQPVPGALQLPALFSLTVASATP